MKEIIHQFVQWILNLVSDMGYFGIYILMTLESTLVPVPSEVVLIPAGYHVSTGEMHWFGVVLAGVLGSLTGATLNYVIALWFGRGFVLKYGKYFLLTEAKFIKLESAFLKHGNFVTFVGRLIFGVRHWISIPAGLARMPFAPFAILTLAGSALWVVILVVLGYVLGAGENATEVAKLIGYWLAGALVVMTGAYILWWKANRGNGDSKPAVVAGEPRSSAS